MKAKLLNLLLTLLVLTGSRCSKTDEPEPFAPVEEIKPPGLINGAPDTSRLPASVLEYKVQPQATDTAIRPSDEPHYAYVRMDTTQINKLLLFMGGTNTSPVDFQEFSKTAATLGYHVVNIKYPNNVTVRVCEDVTEMGCFTQYHDEVIFGGTQSEAVEVNVPNAVINRVMKLLQYLHNKNPREGWNQFYTDTGLVFSRLVVAGHSQGGDHAAYLAYKYALNRLIVLCAPNDYSRKYDTPAAWCRDNFATSTKNMYGLMHKRDEIVPPAEHYATWRDMKMLQDADTTSADRNGYTNSRALYTDIEPNPAATKYKSKHNAPIIDEAIPGNEQGQHIRQVWRYLLGAK